MAAEIERLETAARLAMAHFPDAEGDAFSSPTAYYLRLGTVAAVVIMSGLLGFASF